MKEEIIIAGFGGQGVLSMGKILAYSGLMEGKEVSWMPVTELSTLLPARISRYIVSMPWTQPTR